MMPRYVPIIERVIVASAKKTAEWTRMFGRAIRKYPKRWSTRRFGPNFAGSAHGISALSQRARGTSIRHRAAMANAPMKRPMRYSNLLTPVDRMIGPKPVSSSRMTAFATNDVVTNMKKSETTR